MSSMAHGAIVGARIMEALGLDPKEWAVSEIRLRVDDVATVTLRRILTVDQVDRIAEVLESYRLAERVPNTDVEVPIRKMVYPLEIRDGESIRLLQDMGMLPQTEKVFELAKELDGHPDRLQDVVARLIEHANAETSAFGAALAREAERMVAEDQAT